MATWRKASGREAVPYAQLVEEAICFGWIDSTVNILDDERGLQLMTPRQPKSTWTRLNRQRVAALEADGRMTESGRAAVEIAQANGYWTIYDPVEDLIEPPELAAALDASRSARAAWDAFPASARKQMLWWVISAAKPETRAAPRGQDRGGGRAGPARPGLSFAGPARFGRRRPPTFPP